LYTGILYQVLALGQQPTLKLLWSGSCDPFVRFGALSLEWVKLGTSYWCADRYWQILVHAW